MLKVKENTYQSGPPDNDETNIQLITNNNNTYSIIQGENSSNPYEFEDEINTSTNITSKIEYNIQKDETFSCKLCKKYYKSQNRLDTHNVNFHSTVKTAIKCDHCEVKCINEEALIQHLPTHYKPNNIKCSTCDKNFTRNYQLKRHLKQTGCDGRTKDSFPCQVCGHVFTRKDNLKDHLRNHVMKGIRKKMFKCDTCGKQFSGKQPLINHIRSHTGETPFKCLICPKQFKTNTSLIKHKRCHTGERPFSCSECGKSFTSNEVLNRHIKTHWSEKPHVCQVCGKTFIQIGQLQTHMHHHTGEKIRCKYCDFTSTRKDTVTKHERFKHEGAEKIKCTEEGCDKSFPSNRDLKQHLLIHAAKQFSCQTCKKYFRTQINLRAHERTHRREVARTCLKCHRAYIRADCLLRHMRTKHPDDYKMLRQIAYTTKIEGLKSKLMSNKTAMSDNNLNKNNSSNKNTDVKNDKKIILSETQLVSTIKDLLSFMVDKESLDLFGWPDCSVDEVLNAVIIKFGQEPIKSNELDRAEVLRQNIKMFIVAVIDDDVIDKWIETRPIDEIILEIKQYGQDDK